MAGGFKSAVPIGRGNRRMDRGIEVDECYNDGERIKQSEIADEFLELSLFFKAFQASYSELLCIFPCFCPYGQFTRESFSECI